MPRTINQERATHAERALATYGANEDPFEAVIGLLCDLRHYCDAHGIGYAAQDRTAEEHYLIDWRATTLLSDLYHILRPAKSAPEVQP